MGKLIVALLAIAIIAIRLYPVSDMGLKRTHWKRYSMSCEYDGYELNKHNINKENIEWKVEHKWDGRVFLTLLNDLDPPCVYIGK